MIIQYDSKIFHMQKYGGISRYFIKLIENLPSDCTPLITAGLYCNEALHNSQAKAIGCYINKYPKNTYKLVKNINLILDIYFKIARAPNVIHSTWYNKTQSNSKPTIITIHDLIHEKMPNLFKDSRQILINKSAAISRSNAIICVSENTKKDLMEIYNVPDSKITVIPLASDISTNNSTQFFNPSWAPTSPYILYVGSRSAHKNFTSALSAFSKSQAIGTHKFILFGGGKISSSERLFAKKLGADINSIIQIDGQDNILKELYENATCLIYPSLYEGFGLPPLEAMSLGCPVIASNTSSIPEVTGDAALLFNPLLESEIINAINIVCNDSGARQSLSRAGLAQALKFSWEECAKEHYNVYQKIL